MSLERDVSFAVERFEDGDPEAAYRALGNIFAVAKTKPAEWDRVVEALLTQVDHADPRIGATFATAAGSLVEEGAAARPLARAVIAPLGRTVALARRFLLLAADAPEDSEAEGAVDIGGRMLAPATLEALGAEDADGAIATLSLETWYMPVAASWTRDTETLREVQRDAALRADIDAVSRCGGTLWIASLMRVLFDAPLVVVFPEIGEAWRVLMSGVADLGQLSVLLSDVLAEPLAKLGAERASKALIACMSGDGPQQIGDSYSSTFHLYPWQALDLATGLPRSDLFTWLAPGGKGTHSLPGDYWPGDLEPVAEDVRMLFAVSPKAPGCVGFTRILSGARSFSGLAARLYDARRLPDGAAKQCIDAARLRVATLRGVGPS